MVSPLDKVGIYKVPWEGKIEEKCQAKLGVRGFARHDINYENIYSNLAKLDTIHIQFCIGNPFHFLNSMLTGHFLMNF